MTTSTSGSRTKTKGPIAGLVLFVRQIINELKKVVRPTRQELIRYATVVLVFVGIVMAFIAVVDAGISVAVRNVFG